MKIGKNWGEWPRASYTADKKHAGAGCHFWASVLQWGIEIMRR